MLPNPEDDIADLLTADTANLMTILTGGVYEAALLGVEGITRDATPAAFDANGYLKPCAVVKQRDAIPTSDVVDMEEQIKSAVQVVEIWLYQDAPLYDKVDQAASRIYALLQGEMLAYSFELDLVLDLARQRDNGALSNASLRRLDFQVIFIIQPA